MKTTIRKWGNSLALRIPQAVAAQVHVREGDAVTLRVGAEGLSVIPMSRRSSLDDLLAEITPENLHPATDWGSDVGREIVGP